MHEARIVGEPRLRPSRREMLIGAGLLCTAAVSHAMIPRTSIDLLGEGKVDDIIPEQVGPWSFLSKSGLVVPPSDQLSEKLYAQMLTRVYTADNRAPMMLLIAQSPGQDGVLQVHRPEYCYPAGGYQLVDSRVHQIEFRDGVALPTRAFTAVSPERTEQLLYWTRIGSALPTSWAEQRLEVAKANLRGEIPDAVMVRVSAISTDPAALNQVDEFTRAMVAAMKPKDRQILLGTAIA
jgi:EpsI family protein